MQHSLARARPAELAAELLAQTERLREGHSEDPFGNPVLSAALAISRRLDRHELSVDDVAGVVDFLRDAAFAERASRIAAYVGGTDEATSRHALEILAERLVRPDPADSPVPLAAFRAATERRRFAAVFTAHPTFSLPEPVARALAAAACGTKPEGSFASHRPLPITLDAEFEQAVAAIVNGRDALDLLNGAILAAARAIWPGRWMDLAPCPVILASWVGYDTDGRTDIGWWHTLGLRLRMKRFPA